MIIQTINSGNSWFSSEEDLCVDVINLQDQFNRFIGETSILKFNTISLTADYAKIQATKNKRAYINESEFKNIYLIKDNNSLKMSEDDMFQNFDIDANFKMKKGRSVKIKIKSISSFTPKLFID